MVGCWTSKRTKLAAYGASLGLFALIALCGGTAGAALELDKQVGDKDWADRVAPREVAPLTLRSLPAPRPTPVLDAVKTLQPWYARPGNERDARRVAGIIRVAAERHAIDPRLAVAIAMRESSLRAGRVRGALGEQGMFQVMPNGYARRACPRDCALDQPHCNADVALCYLAHVRELCGSDDPWVWIGAYGMRRCPTGREARAMTSTRRARAYLVAVAGAEQADEIWPM